MTARSEAIPPVMAGVVLTGHGGPERLEFRTDLPTPRPGPGEVLIRTAGSSVNNTDINTRIGWYSKAVSGSTQAGAPKAEAGDATWSGEPLSFPRIQGADCAGTVVASGEGVDPRRVGERVIVRTLMRAPVNFRSFECWTFGSECDGGFAQYACAPEADVFAVKTDLEDEALGVIPCAYSTAEGMLVRAGLEAAETVLITGASGGVGAAAVQLAGLRGGKVLAVCGAAKHDAVGALGADRLFDRESDLLQALGRRSVDVVVDLVGGPGFATLPELLKRGGRYVTAGAIAGADVRFDLRTLYLNDLTFFGCVSQEDVVFENLVAHVNRGALVPPVATRFALRDIHAAQKRFLSKDFVGKVALHP